jgi:LysM repeat protein
MGQLEKYGLYVLCLVIFLILGVTTMGGDPPSPSGRSQSAAINAPAGPSGTASPTANTPRPTDAALTRSLQDLLSPGGGNGAAPPTNGGVAGGDPRRTDPPKTDPTAKVDPAPKAEPGKLDPPKSDPAAPTRVAYKVQDNDTLDGIARARLGSSSLWKDIVKLNPGLEPTKLRAGKEIWLPTMASLKAADSKKSDASKTDNKTDGKKTLTVPALAGGDRTYTVKKGDNFERIAVAQLGSKKRAQELIAMNPGIEPTKLKLGMQLALPKK